MITAHLALHTSLAIYNLVSDASTWALTCSYQSNSCCVDLQFSMYLVHNSGLLQEVLLNSSSFNNGMSVKVDVDVFPKSTGVVISYGLCIAEG